MPASLASSSSLTMLFAFFSACGKMHLLYSAQPCVSEDATQPVHSNRILRG